MTLETIPSLTNLSLITPPLPTCPFSASNWGLMSITRSTFSVVSTFIAGMTFSTDINERSRVTKSTFSGSWVRFLKLVRSRTTQLGWSLILFATCPYPTSTPYTLLAPLCNSTSVNPPVERPESNATRSRTLSWKWSNAASSLRPPLHTYLGMMPSICTSASLHTCAPALLMIFPSTRTCPCTIHDWTTLRLTSGRSCRQISSSLCFFFPLFRWWGSTAAPRTVTQVVFGRRDVFLRHATRTVAQNCAACCMFLLAAPVVRRLSSSPSEEKVHDVRRGPCRELDGMTRYHHQHFGFGWMVGPRLVGGCVSHIPSE